MNRSTMTRALLAVAAVAAIAGVAGYTARAASAQQLEQAIANGDASLATTKEIEDAILANVATQKTACESTLGALYPTGLTAHPRAQFVTATTSLSPANIPVDFDKENRVFSWAGVKPGGSKYVYYGGNILARTKWRTLRRDDVLNAMRWLLGQGTAVDITSQPLVLVFQRQHLLNQMNAWITANGLTVSWTLTTDTTLVDSGGAYDLYLHDARYNEKLATLKTALASTKPVFGTSDWWEPRGDALQEFGLSRAWVGRTDTINETPAVADVCANVLTSAAIGSLVTRLRDGMPDFNYESCTNSIGTFKCDGNVVAGPSGTTQNEAFFNAANAIRSAMTGRDTKGISLFSLGDDLRLDKLLALLGDKYRAAVVFPYSRQVTPDTTLYRSLFADYTVLYNRTNNPSQPNVGNYATRPSRLTNLAGVTRQFTATPTDRTTWTSTGIYAPDGRTITVRRTDATSAQVRLRFHMLRTSTRVWNPGFSYARPRYISSPSILIEPGRDYQLSTPYGHPLYVQWTGVSGTPAPFTVEFENVLEHPLIENFDAASLAAFSTELDATPFDWVDIKTPYAEIHMLTSYTKNAINNTYGGDSARYFDHVNKYLIINNYWYAGFNGPGIPPLEGEVAAFCTEFGLDCTDPVVHRRPNLQHVNSDRSALCGALCSGNPFDSGQPVDPRGWGENHEMGHNLQRGRFNLYGRSGETSNNIFPWFTQSTYAADQSLLSYGAAGSNQSAYNLIQSARAAGNGPGTTHPLWAGPGAYTNAGERLMFFTQLAYANGSPFIHTKMYLLDRMLSAATANDTKWLAERDKIFFSLYSRDEGRSVTARDFMYIAASCISRKDHFDFFTFWGLEVSAKARQQVATCGTTGSIPLEFYHVDSNVNFGEFPAFASNVLPLDGTSAYRDPDLDNDRARNEVDAFVLDPTEQKDFDRDEIGDNADPDDDNDGMSDVFELANGFNPFDASDGVLDPDRDGFTNAEEFAGGSLPNDTSSRPSTSADVWLTAASLAIPRTNHTASLLNDGRVLVAGGLDASTAPVNSVELYDVAANAWSNGPLLAQARVGHTATLLANGDVLVAGGLSDAFEPLASAERFVASTGQWQALAGVMRMAREEHSATRLADGKVLVVGGKDDFGALREAEIFDPAAGTWAATGSLGAARRGHTATLLADGKVLVVGGRGDRGALQSAEVFDPASGSWTAVAGTFSRHHEHSATRLNDGSVLVVGGQATGAAIATTEVYDVATNRWTTASPLFNARDDHTAVLLPNGAVLVTGGNDGNGDLDSAEVYTPADGNWRPSAGMLPRPRSQHTATLLPDGRVLLTGGFDDFEVLGSSALYAY